jgi:phage shock protein PspC (stress-responsive transcriptional regulator)
MANPGDQRQLRRSRDKKMLFGVCAGLAEYFGTDPTLVRIGFVVAGLIPMTTAISLIGYIVLALILPEEGMEDLGGRERVQRNLDTLRSDVSGLTGNVMSRISGESRSESYTTGSGSEYERSTSTSERDTMAMPSAASATSPSWSTPATPGSAPSSGTSGVSGTSGTPSMVGAASASGTSTGAGSASSSASPATTTPGASTGTSSSTSGDRSA